MGYESCAEKYSSLFSPELKQIFTEHDLSIPYILEFLEDEPLCDDTGCEHHVFHSCMEFGSSNTGEVIRKDVEWVKKCHRCMCLLPLVDKDLTLQDIADAMGVTREGIRLQEAAGIRKLQKRYAGVMGGDGIVRMLR